MRSLLVAVLLVIAPVRAWSAEPRRPNIVVILADDFGYECVGANGGAYATPHLDALAANGVRFTHCHVQPLCTPTRAELLTGKSNKRTYVDFGMLPTTETTFAHLLRDAGYATAVAGKWQLGKAPDSPRHFGFGSALLWNHTRRAPRYANPGLDIDGLPRDFTAGEYGPDLVSEFALEFTAQPHGRPFLLYYPLMLTHNPFQPTPHDPDWDPTARGEKVGADPRLFPGMVAHLDRLVGRLMEWLEAHRLRDDTLVVFLGDNGTSPSITGSLDGVPFRGGKGTTTHRGTHVPLIVSWPAAIRRPAVCDDLVAAVDILPTICAAAGVPIPAGGDGLSFLPQLRGQPGETREWIHAWYRPRLSRPRDAREYAFDHHHKLDTAGGFFDLRTDPEEKNPLPVAALSPDQRAAHAKLSAALTRYADARPAELLRIDAQAPATAGGNDE